jgi:hypothetical protein
VCMWETYSSRSWLAVQLALIIEGVVINYVRGSANLSWDWLHYHHGYDQYDLVVMYTN